MNRSRNRWLALPIALLAVSGCAGTHGLKSQATMRDASSLSSERSLAQGGVDPSAWPAQDWWTRFGDPQLDALMDEALKESPTLQVALARVRQASALAQSAKAQLAPRVDSNLSMTRERFPQSGLVPPPFAGSWTYLNQLQASFTWDLDFWGGRRAAFHQQLDQARAADVDAHAARLALSVDVAHAYVQLLRAYLQLDVAQATLAQREHVYQLTRDRNAAGLDSKLELKQAEAAVPAAREQVAQLDETIDILRHQIAALVGQGPDRGLAIDRPAAMQAADATLPSRVPSQLLGRRPDVVAARWRAEAAGQGIRVAKAQFYPDVNLTALIGFQNVGGTASFLSLGNREIGAGPAVTLPLFDAGQRRADLAAADAAYDEAVGQYNQTLSDALRDVADQLTSFHSVDVQRIEQQHALEASRTAYDLAVLRYKEGVGNYLQVLSAEAPLLAQESLEADLRARTLDLSVNLVRALGGGYAEDAQPLAASGNASAGSR